MAVSCNYASMKGPDLHKIRETGMLINYRGFSRKTGLVIAEGLV